MRVVWIGALAGVLGGCSGQLTGEWQGVLECGTIKYDFSLEMAKDSGKSFTGTGVQEREFTAVDGNTTFEEIEFDILASLARGGGAQSVDVEMTCTFEQVVVTGIGGNDEPQITRDTCQPLRFRNYQAAWDGKDQITFEGEDACEGTVNRL